MLRFLVSGIGRSEVCTGWEVLWKQGLLDIRPHEHLEDSACVISHNCTVFLMIRCLFHFAIS